MRSEKEILKKKDEVESKLNALRKHKDVMMRGPQKMQFTYLTAKNLSLGFIKALEWMLKGKH